MNKCSRWAGAVPPMVALGVVSLCEFDQRTPKRIFSKENYPVQAFGFHASRISFNICVQVRASRRQWDHIGVRILKFTTEMEKLLVSVEQKILRVIEKSVVTIDQVPGGSLFPHSLGIQCYTGNLNATCRQFHHNQNVVGHQPGTRPDVNGYEISGANDLPVCLKKLTSRGLFLARG